MFAAEDSHIVKGAFRTLFRYGRQQAPHENRDAIAAAVFISAAVVAAVNVELHRFGLAFWIAAGLAVAAWMSSYHKLVPLIALFGFVALRLAFAFIIEQKLIELLIALVFAGMALLLLRLQRQ